MGNQTFKLKTPDGEFDLVADNYKAAVEAAQKAGVNVIPPTKSTFDMAPELFNKGMMFGLPDYAGAAVRTLGQRTLPERGDFKHKSYGQNLSDIRGAQNQYSNENFWMSTLAQIAGGVTSPISLLINNKVAASIPNAPKPVQYMATGGVGGGLAGLGYSQGQDGGLPSAGQAVLDTAIGTGVGVIGGLVLPPVFQGVSNALGKLRSFTTAGADKMAVSEILKNIGRDKTTAQDIVARAQGMGPDIAVADVPGFPSTQRLADSAVQQPGQSAKIYADVSEARNATRIDRLQGETAKSITGVKYFDRWLEKLTSRSRAAAPKYDLLESTFDDLSQRSDKLAVWQGDPRVREGYKLGVQRVANDALNEGRAPDLTKYRVTDFDADGNPIVNKVPIQSIKQWDTVKRGLDRRLNTDKSLRDEFGRLNDDGNSLKLLRNNIRDHLDELTTVNGKSLYKDARAAWADDSAYLESMGDGFEFMKWAGGADSKSPIAPEMALKEFRKLTDPEKEAFRIGMRQQFDNIIGQKGNVPEALNQLTNPKSNLARRVRPYFENSNNFDDFVNAIKSEKAMIASDRRYAGSQTNVRGAAEDDLGVPSDFSQAAGDMMAGSPQQGIMGLASGLWKSMSSPVLPEAARDQVGRYLLQPGARDSLLAAIRGNNTPGFFRNPVGNYSINQLVPGLLGGASVLPSSLRGTLPRQR
jgi:hypothetical protein